MNLVPLVIEMLDIPDWVLRVNLSVSLCPSVLCRQGWLLPVWPVRQCQAEEWSSCAIRPGKDFNFHSTCRAKLTVVIFRLKVSTIKDKALIGILKENVSGYVCNHGSPSGERDTASPRGRYGERPQRDSVWRYIWKNTTCWPATAHDVTTGVPQYKCRREDTSSASSSEACVRSMAQSPGDAVSRSPLGEPWLHT